jgi:hypothetical protein
MKRLVFCFVIVLLAPMPAFAIIRNVPSQYSTIQAGINASMNGDTILVSPGIYSEHILFSGRNVLVKSLTGPSTTIIQKTSDFVPIVRFQNGETNNACIDGFSIRNSTAAGIKCTSSSPIIQNCIIENNSADPADEQGAGITVRGAGASPLIRKNTIRNNICTGNYAGGIFTNNNMAYIDSNLFYGNIGNEAGAIACYGGSAIIMGNLIYSNEAAIMSGGILLASLTSGTIINNTIATNVGASEAGGVLFADCSNIDMKNNIVYDNNLYGTYARNSNLIHLNYNCHFENDGGDIAGVLPENGNIVANPLFINPASYNFMLGPGSPCINTGDPLSPSDPDGTRVDMGAPYIHGLYPLLGFDLISPLDNSILSNIPITFSWGNCADIDSGFQVLYTMYWSESIQFLSTDSTGLISDTNYTLTNGLNRSHFYYWRVSAFDHYTNPFYSNEIWSFYLDGYPTRPTIFAPLNGVNAESSTVLSWYISTDPDSFDAVSYTIQIDNDTTFSSPEINQTGLQSGAIIDNAFAIRLGELEGFSNLQMDNRYFWRVRADDNYGLSSDWTDGTNWFVFMAQNDSPNPPISGFSPSNYEEVISLTPTISWDDATDPDDISDSLRYIIQIFTELPGLTDGGVYYFYFDTTASGVNRFVPPDTLFDNCLVDYHVKTLDPHGLTSDWSEYQLFWTNHYNFPPEPFPLISPADSTRQVDYYTHFAWDEPYDLDPNSTITISLEISQDSLFNQIFWSKDSLQDYSLNVATDSIPIIGPSYWRVLATDDDGLVRVGGIPEGARYLMILPPGDANANGVTNGLDVTYLVNYLKGLGPAPDPLLAADANGNCSTNGLDVTYLVNYLKGIGPAPLRGQCDVILSGGETK